MDPDAIPESDDGPEILCYWSARKMNPIILLYVAVVFVTFIALSYFVFQSMTGVKALALAAVGAIFSLIPGVSGRVEYRLTGGYLEHRPLGKKEPGEFERVFQLDQLSHVVPTRDGFKFYLPLNDSNPLRRFWKSHVSDAFSGEVHVEMVDRERVLDVLAQHGIPCRRSRPFQK